MITFSILLADVLRPRSMRTDSAGSMQLVHAFRFPIPPQSARIWGPWLSGSRGVACEIAFVECAGSAPGAAAAGVTEDLSRNPFVLKHYRRDSPDRLAFVLLIRP